MKQTRGMSRTLASVCALAAIGVTLLAATGVGASQLLLPHLGGRDSGMAGNVVATPGDGASVLLFNPAGVADIHGAQAAFGFMSANMTGRYSDPATGYDAKSSELAVAPTFWLSTDKAAPWHVGVGVYGATGSAFSFAADPGSGIPGQLLGESAVLNFALVVGRELAPGFRVGVQLAATHGHQKGRTPSPLGNVEFDIDGFGASGSVGLLYDISPRTTFGLAYRAPGIVSMSGDGDVGGTADKVKLDLRLPQGVTLGFAQQLSDRLLVAAQASWTRYEDFERGEYQFESNPALNQPFIADARAVVRWGAGLEYAVSETAWLRCGFSSEPWMIEASAVRPTLYDATDVMLMLGFGVKLDRWTTDAMIGFGHMDDRVVTAQDQALFPGRYEVDGGIGVGVTVTYEFATKAQRLSVDGEPGSGR